MTSSTPLAIIIDINKRSAMFRKLIIILSAIALQGCLVDFHSPSPRPRPDIACEFNRHCPGDSYCEVDGYCYENPFYTECYSDRDCPLDSYCGMNGLCYQEYHHHGQCYVHSDCAPGYFCSVDGICYYLHQ